MNFLDSAVTLTLNEFSQVSWSFDYAMVFFASAHLAKGGIFMAVLWWWWFKDGNKKFDYRERVISALLSAFVAVAAGRILAIILPFRARPLHETSIDFLPPLGMTSNVLEGWSSFPSDHAVLFFSLSVSLFFLSRKLGLCALAYTVFLIAFPRIYIGFHYASDILVGGIIGAGIGLLGNSRIVVDNVSRRVLGCANSTPALFYPVLFLLTFQIAEMFESTREGIKFAVHVYEQACLPNESLVLK